MNRAIFLDRDGVINVDTGYTIIIDSLESMSGKITVDMAGKKVAFTKYLEDEETYTILDLTEASGNADYSFYLDDYLDIEVWNLSDTSEVMFSLNGVSFNETGSCVIRQKYIFNLDNQKYIIGFFKIEGTADVPKFNFVFL